MCQLISYNYVLDQVSTIIILDQNVIKVWWASADGLFGAQLYLEPNIV